MRKQRSVDPARLPASLSINDGRYPVGRKTGVGATIVAGIATETG